MLNYNLNIISPLQQEKKNEDIRIPIFWTFQSVASASDSTDLGESGYASMSIYAPDSNALGIANDAAGNFDTDAQFYVSATLTGSNWPVTGSTTMSIFTSGITYDPLAIDKYFYQAFSASAAEIAANPSITGSVIKNEYSASEFYRFFNDARIVHMKGNDSNSVIRWYVTGSSDRYLSSSSLNITKDANITMVTQSLEIETGSSFRNTYALNQTASLRSNYIPYLSNDSSSINIAKINLEISEIGFTSSQWISASCATQTNIITSSFVSQVSIPEYNISASLTEYSIPVFTVFVTASGGGAGGGVGGTGGGGGGGMTVSSSIIIVPNVTYNLYIASASGIAQNGDNSYVYGYNNCPNVTYNVFAGGGQAPVTVSPFLYQNGGDSGTGSIIENGVTIQTYPSFSGGAGASLGGPFPINASGGGASNAAAGGNANASGTSATQGGDGASGYTAGGGGGLATSGPTPPGPGRPGFNGSGITGLGGIYNSGGGQGQISIRYNGSGSRFTATNASVSYDGGTNTTTYLFNTPGTASLIYLAEPVI